MTPFYDEADAPDEPVRGLPELLPAGEKILWQGRPDTLAFAVHVFHVRFIALYLAVMVGWRMVSQASAGAPAETLVGIATSGLVFGLVGMAITLLIAWAMARSAVFTMTNRRLVLRFGVAIRKYVNLPFAQLASADLRLHRKGADGGHGDIAITPTKAGKGVGYIYLWPFARPMRFGRPQPSLRAISDAAAVARQLGEALAAFQAIEGVNAADASALSSRASAEPHCAPGAAQPPQPAAAAKPGSAPQAPALTGRAQPA